MSTTEQEGTAENTARRTSIIRRIADLKPQDEEDAWTLHFAGTLHPSANLLAALRVAASFGGSRDRLSTVCIRACRRAPATVRAAARHNPDDPEQAAALAFFLAQSLWYCHCDTRRFLAAVRNISTVASVECSNAIALQPMDVAICQALLREPDRRQMLTHYSRVLPFLTGQADANAVFRHMADPRPPQILRGGFYRGVRDLEGLRWRAVVASRSLLLVQLESMGWNYRIENRPVQRRPRGKTAGVARPWLLRRLAPAGSQA